METLSLRTLINYLPSDRPLRANLKEDKTWFARPTCVGALAAAKITERLGKSALSDEDIAEILKEKGIEKLVDNLANPKRDKYDTAVIALSHLVSPQTPEFKAPLLSDRAKAVWVRLLLDSREEMCIAVSKILHSVFLNSKNCKNSLLNYDRNVILHNLIILRLKDPVNMAMHLKHLRAFYLDEDRPNAQYVNIMRDLGTSEIVREVSLGADERVSAECKTILGELS
jgi:hypothetical protein